MSIWNDTDIPQAYLITFRCYGTWLHGDSRGSISRHKNLYNSRRLPPDEKWREKNRGRLKQEPVKLNALQRSLVETAIRETCEIRKWNLKAVNVRTNHVHVVVSIGSKKPGLALNALKANATTGMRQKDCWESDRSPWSKRGSKRFLWNEKSVAAAVDYVINGQGDDLPDFT